MSVVRVASCRPNPWNRRRPVDPDLRDSIKECGLLQPIVVREMGDGLDQEGVADMSKPWDGEETPLTNAACLAETWPDVVLPTGQVPAPFARDLERRCRNAEKLLDECRSIMAANGLYPITRKRVSAHLAAAAQEDGLCGTR